MLATKEKSHPGFQLPIAALHPGFGFAISNTATGLADPSYNFRGGPRSSGYFRDSETGLDYAKNRYHQPGMGRFLSPDPYLASVGAADPGSWNRYAYTRGDPVNRKDSRGTCDQSADTDKSVTVCGDDDDDDGDSGGGYDQGAIGGGGSFEEAQVLPKVVSNYTQAQMQALTNGYNNALDDVETNVPCDQFLAGDQSGTASDSDIGDVVSTLLNTNYRLLPFAAGTGAQTNSPNSVFVNSNGAFFTAAPNPNGTVTVNVTNAAGGLTPLTFANVATLQGFLLLHELGHQTGVLGPDAGPGVPPGTNASNSQAILDNCFKKNAQGVYSN